MDMGLIETKQGGELRMQNRLSFGLVTLVASLLLLAGPVQGADARKATKTVKPTYPTIALQMRIEGTVRLQAVVGSNGSVNNVIVVSGPPALRNSAVDCVKQWQYEPSKESTLVPIEINFKITN
jgi:TonB family protein